MLLIIKLLVCFGVPLSLGLLLIAAGLRERLAVFAWPERLVLALAIGLWALALAMFGLPFLKIPLSLSNIVMAVVLLELVLIPFSVQSLRFFLPDRRPRIQHLFFYILWLLIIFKIGFVFWFAFIKPIIDPDILVYYGLAAKYTFINQFPIHLYGEPPMPFLLESWPSIALGYWEDTLLPCFSPWLYLSL